MTVPTFVMMYGDVCLSKEEPIQVLEVTQIRGWMHEFIFPFFFNGNWYIGHENKLEMYPLGGQQEVPKLHYADKLTLSRGFCFHQHLQ